MKTNQTIENPLHGSFPLEKILLFLILIFSSIASLGQNQSVDAIGLPFIKNYTKENYITNGSNQAITQDQRQVIYFGNQDGVLEFDGNEWRLIPTSNNSFPKALAVETFNKSNSKIRKSGRIYTGGKGELGYLNIDSTGQLTCTSLLSLIPKEYHTFEDIIRIEVTDDAVIFQSFRYIFLLSNDQVKVITPSSQNSKELFHKSWSYRNQYFVRQWGKGLLTLKNEALEMVPGGDFFATERIYEMLPFSNDTLLFATRTKGLMLFDGKDFTPWDNQANSFLIKNEVYCGAKLNANTFIFGTINGGLIILNRGGEVLQIIDKKRGLLDNLVFHLFVDVDQNLWVAHTNGVSYISFDSPFQAIDERANLEGQGFTAIKYNDYYWFGTLRGLYKMPSQVDKRSFSKKNNLQPEPIKGRNSSTMALVIAGDVLLGAQTTGVIAVDKNDRVKNILKDRISFSFLKLKNNPGHLIVGTVSGLVLLKNTQTNPSLPANWVYQSDIDGFGGTVFYIAEGKSNEIWVGDEVEGILKLQLNPTLDSVLALTLYDEGKGLPKKSNNRLYEIDNEIVITTEKGIYQYNASLDSIIVDARFENSLNDSYVHTLTQLKNGNIWLWASSGKNSKSLHQMELMQLKKNGDSYRLVKGFHKQMSEYYRSLFPNIINLEDQNILLVQPAGFFNYKIKTEGRTPKSIPIFIRQVSNIERDDDLLFSGNLSDKNGIPKTNQVVESLRSLPFDKRSLRFEWAALSYTNPEKTQYQYLLENFDNSWSNWSDLNQKEYTNIPFGKYQFRVKARNVLGQESEEAIYIFKILKPWYLKWYAILGYLIFGILLVRGIIQLYVGRLIKQKESLEATVQARTKEIQEQKAEIEKEKQKSEDILLNILPHETAEELKTHGSTKARKYDSVSVMFTDFKDFTTITKDMDPEVLVPLIDSYFRTFDHIISKYKIEKIKTIGDSFMCAGGIPIANDSHGVDIIRAALEIRDYVNTVKIENKALGNPFFDIRIGVNTGPLVAGVVGNRKYAYDIWGATVNLASRMESFGMVGEVNISYSTYKIIKDKYHCFHRGKIEIDKLGPVDMYLVKEEKSRI